MCLAIPLKLVEIDGKRAVGEAMGMRRELRVDFIDKPKLGEYVIVHAGFAIERLGEQQALEDLESWGRSPMRSDISEARERILSAIAALPVGNVKLMEVCGTHTMAIAKSGLRAVLPENVQLLSGPGCPVCVTPPEIIDAMLALAMRPEVIIASYGDMLRVPGSKRGDSLARRRALGARVEIVYSPVDAVALAKANPEKEIVFLGVGFETTAPGTAAAVLTARDEGVSNFSVWSMLKTVEPALRAR